MLDVTAKDVQGVQLFGETKVFNMVGYPQPNQQGQPTTDNWLIRSWKDNAIQPGRTAHPFAVSVPDGVNEIDVQATLVYQVGDAITPMATVSQRIPVTR